MLGRKIHLERAYKRLLDTTFSFMCEEARSAVDYLELVKHFDVFVLRDIPFVDVSNRDVLRRFVVLVDALYDNHVKLLCSGKASSPQMLFDLDQAAGGVHDVHFALDRTISRLIDMQSENYHKSSASASTKSIH